MADAVNQKARAHQLDFIGSLLQEKAKNRVFVKFDSRYADYFPEYSSYFEGDLILLKSMYGMTNFGKFFSDDFTEWLIESGFIQSQYQMSLYPKYAPDGTKIVILSYVDDFVYWYTYEALERWCVETLGNIFHVNFLGYAHLFISISISQIKDHSISVDQDRYHCVAQ